MASTSGGTWESCSVFSNAVMVWVPRISSGGSDQLHACRCDDPGGHERRRIDRGLARAAVPEFKVEVHQALAVERIRADVPDHIAGAHALAALTALGRLDEHLGHVREVAGPRWAMVEHDGVTARRHPCRPHLGV